MNTSDSPSVPTPGDSADEWDESDAPSALPRLSVTTWAWVIAGLAALIAIASWIGWYMSNEPLRWRDVGYQIVSPTEATVTYDVFFYTDADAICHLRAVNVRFAEIGAATQEVKRADGPQQRLTATLVTTETANTVIVDYCEVAK